MPLKFHNIFFDMSKKARARKANFSFNDSPSRVNAKRKCNETNRKTFAQSENILWSETDESFFSNSVLDNLLSNGQKSNKDLIPSTQSFADDSIFSKIDVLQLKCENLPSALEVNESIFAHVDLKELTSKERADVLCAGNDGNERNVDEWLVQNTQKFLGDLAFKVPQRSVQRPRSAANVRTTMLTGIIHGSQYETNDEILNRSLTGNEQHEVANIASLDWESQAFLDLSLANDFPEKGSFYGLPETVKKLIFEHKGIASLYEWQDECLHLPAIKQRKNLIYALPTSGGKTLVAEILILRELICRQKNVLFILPYVSIVQEKVSAMSPFAIALDFIIEEYTAGKGKCPPIQRRKRKSLFVCSIEKGAVLMDSLIEAERANEIGLVVVDELHLIGEAGRGATLETLLTKIMFLNANIQIVGMSATIGNLTEISTFLKADVYTRGFRPVELREYIKCGNDILEINSSGKTIEETFVFNRTVDFKYSKTVLRTDPDHLAGLVSECAPENCCLIFCSTRRNCENVSLLLSRLLPKSKFFEHRQKEKKDLMDALETVCGILSPVLAKTIPFGIAYHHSGLTSDERKFIETAYRFGVISVICCTSTLAAGVNLPAKRVIIRAPYVGSEFITLSKYKQMVGRAGRTGLGEAGESILIASSRDNVRLGEMLFSPMDKAMSSLDYGEGLGLQNLIMSGVGLGLACCRRELNELLDNTLLFVQSQQLNVSIQSRLLSILRDMFQNRVLELMQPNKSNDSSNLIITQDVNSTTTTTTTATNNKSEVSNINDRRLFISRSTRFRLTPIGRAAFKAGIDYKRAYVVYRELKRAQGHMILENYSHLLYLIVAFNSNGNGDELFAADASILFRIYNALDETTRKLCELLGFTEAHAARLGKTQSIKGAMELKLNRLFKVFVLVDMLNVMPVPSVAAKYNIERGTLQHLISQSTAAASAVVRLCEQIEEFWCYKSLFDRISAKMDHCATVELEPLLELPAVKINRAKQFYNAGYKTVGDIAKCHPVQLTRDIEHMPYRIAKEIVAAAKIILMKKLDHLEEETETLKLCLLNNSDF